MKLALTEQLLTIIRSREVAIPKQLINEVEAYICKELSAAGPGLNNADRLERRLMVVSRLIAACEQAGCSFHEIKPIYIPLRDLALEKTTEAPCKCGGTARNN